MNKTMAGVCCLLLAAALAGCGSAPQTSALPEREIVTATEAPTEEFTDIPPKEEPTEPETNVLLYDDNDVQIYYRGCDASGIRLNYIYNNDTGQRYYITYRVSSVNGEPIESVFDGTLNAGQGEAAGWFAVPIEALQDKGIARIDEVEVNIQFCKDYRSYDMYFETGTIKITR